MENDDQPQRPPLLDETALTPRQKAVFDAIGSGPRGRVAGPLRIWLFSPDLADRAQALGAYCRYGTRLPPWLSELAILVVGAHWRSGYEWHAHAPIALEAGVPADAIEAIRLGDVPRLANEESRAVYRFCRQLLETRTVDDDTYRMAVGILGLEATVDLVGILGYYTLISMTINAFSVPDPTAASGGA